MARSKVPQFGKWENQGDIPYTVCFDQARMNRAGKMINPNDPSENPDMFPNMNPSPFAPPPKPRARQEDPVGRGENGHFRQSSNSSGRGENTGPRPGYESNHGGGRGQRPARPSRPSAAGSDLSFENSPHHPSKANGRGGGPHTSEGRKVDSSHGNHGRSRLRQPSPVRGGAAVPKFDPDSGENFTDIFERVREERNAGPRIPSATPTNRTPRHGERGQHFDVSKKNQPFWHRFVFFWRK